MIKRPCVMIASALLLAPSAAQAHLVATGMGPLYDGAAHFALSPEDVLPVTALALFAGLRGPACARLLLGVLPLAWFVGGLLTSLFGLTLAPVGMSAATALMLLLIGGLLAGNVKLTTHLSALLALALGLIRGAADLSGAAPHGREALAIVGMTGAAFVLFALAASISLPLQRFWMVTATRVTGSWLAATGLLLAGWIIRYGGKVQ